MHSLARVARQARVAAIRERLSPMRPFTQAPTLKLKEDGNRTPEELDRIKLEQVEKQKQGKGHWHEELASSSESNTAADKLKVDNHDQHIQDLQKETAKQHEKEHPEGKAY